MIHAYSEYFVPVAQEKLGSMFELAVLEEKLDIEDFTNKFLSSPVSKAFERADPVYLEGKSANELLALVLGEPPKQYEQGSFASAEYWVGFALAYTQWYLNLPFCKIVKYFGVRRLLENYFPYHEMDITQTVDLIREYIPSKNKLKELRAKKGYSQSDLARLSNVPVRNIRSYEQGTQDISKACAETLYALSKVLDCTIEDLIC